MIPSEIQIIIKKGIKTTKNRAIKGMILGVVFVAISFVRSDSISLGWEVISFIFGVCIVSNGIFGYRKASVQLFLDMIEDGSHIVWVYENPLKVRGFTMYIRVVFALDDKKQYELYFIKNKDYYKDSQTLSTYLNQYLKNAILGGYPKLLKYYNKDPKSFPQVVLNLQSK